VDLLGYGDAAADALLGTFREIMAVEADDGVVFDLEGLRTEASGVVQLVLIHSLQSGDRLVTVFYLF